MVNLSGTATELLRSAPSVIGTVIAFLLYRLNQNIRRDNWARTLREFHQFFWTDVECKRVRSWIACDESYENIRPILLKRQENQYISEKEYMVLETIDKFFALLDVYKKLEFKDGKYKALTRRAFDEYWLGSLTTSKRPELRAYVLKFYRGLQGGLPPDNR